MPTRRSRSSRRWPASRRCLLYVIFAAALAPRLRWPRLALVAGLAGPALAFAGIIASAPLVLDGGAAMSDAEVRSAFEAQHSLRQLAGPMMALFLFTLGSSDVLPRRLALAARAGALPLALAPLALAIDSHVLDVAANVAFGLDALCIWLVSLWLDGRRRRDAGGVRSPRGVPDARRGGGAGRAGVADRAALDGGVLRLGPRPRVAGRVRGRRLRRLGRALCRRTARAVATGARAGRGGRRAGGERLHDHARAPGRFDLGRLQAWAWLFLFADRDHDDRIARDRRPGAAPQFRRAGARR